MKALQEVLRNFSDGTISILDARIPLASYTPLDLSTENSALVAYDVADPTDCQRYINQILNAQAAEVAYGGYLEQRNLYADKANFNGKSIRNIHLGIDFWSKAGTKVLVPIDGNVHSFQNNTAVGDYGPTIILAHDLEGFRFYSLYGHLSLESIADLKVGKRFKKGETLASLGTPDINVNYAPHLHFQLISNLQNKNGDYPGVCNENELKFYIKNCPNPNLLLKLP